MGTATRPNCIIVGDAGKASGGWCYTVIGSNSTILG